MGWFVLSLVGGVAVGSVAAVRAQVAGLVVVAGWATYQLFWNLPRANLAADEPVYAKAGVAYVHGDFTANREHPPVAKYLYGLAQVLFGHGIGTARYVAAGATLATGVILFLWVRQEIGWWAGVLAGGLWTLVPMAGAGLSLDIGRLALLEPVMMLFAIAALAAGRQWQRTDRWWWLPLSGGLLALSVTTKVSTVLLLPLLVLLPVVERRGRRLPVGLALVLGGFAVVSVAVYAPMGMTSAIRYMVDFQHHQQVDGHLADVAGHVTLHPPWWADLWYLEQGVGPIPTLALGVAVVAALALRSGPLVDDLLLGLALLCLFYLGIAAIALPYYYYAFMPFVTTLAAIGCWRLWELRAPAGRALAVALVLVLAGDAGVQSVRVWQAHPTGIARVAPTLKARGITSGGILFAGYSPSLSRAYVDGTGDGVLRNDVAPYVAIVIGDDARIPEPPEVAALLKDERSRFTYVDLDGTQLWIPDAPIRVVAGRLTVD